MNKFEEKLDKYASLAVEIGVNVQPGQTLVVTAPITAADFVRKIVKRAYQVGAKHVLVDWSDDQITRLQYELAPDEAFREYPLWKAKGWEEMAENNAAFLYIDANDPDLLNGIAPQRIQDAKKAKQQALTTFRSYGMSDKISWSIVAVPSQAWADKVFPSLESDRRIEALWEAIFAATRINMEDPVQAWKDHADALDTYTTRLNTRQYKALHFRAPGTDLTVELLQGHLWINVTSVNDKGTPFISNLPVEEVYTAPLKTGVNGIVSSTKPLSYTGNLIDNFSLTFKDGKIVDFTAEKGYDTLQGLIDTDEGSHFLGEVALVPHRSPISDTNLIFYKTLFDENAASHLAIGQSYPFCLEGGKEMSPDELGERGLNDSLAHVDFMIGSADMDIDGILPDGSIEPVFRAGNWAF
ncbi:aminopeptidase [Paenibacillus selenitireducens]|uniref:Aminopeptidase n=1 Tax=Paenibacillus selenitireducens TaxID=1324314 RepID=A0A1T2XMB5_9BACL|nr:aminopeptidase [Paenibacillus selenitireducens]OPA80962.1 aminopeptidase [Paenibacillus selenitireducens]